MSEVPPELIQAYKSTSFCARTSDPVVIRVGALSQSLDRLLDKAGLKTWAFITASNPESRELTLEENVVRNSQLLNDVDAYQPHVYAGKGVPDNPDWNSEASLLILGIAKHTALKLGFKYRQNAIVYGAKAELAELLLCRPGPDLP